MNSDKKEDCKNWLLRRLKKYEGLETKETMKKAKELGYSKLLMKQVRLELGVKTFHQFDENGRDTGNFFWYL